MVGHTQRQLCTQIVTKVTSVDMFFFLENSLLLIGYNYFNYDPLIDVVVAGKGGQLVPAVEGGQDKEAHVAEAGRELATCIRAVYSEESEKASTAPK